MTKTRLLIKGRDPNGEPAEEIVELDGTNVILTTVVLGPPIQVILLNPIKASGEIEP